MRIYVTGNKGFLGEKLTSHYKKESHDVFGSDIETDITDHENIRKKILDAKPDVLVHTAALCGIDICNENPGYTKKVNIDGTRNIVNICRKNRIRLVFISTDYIFDGKNGNYDESDTSNPLNLYGKTKLEAEKIAMRLDDALIIRTASIYGYNDIRNKSFVWRVIHEVEKGRNVDIPKDQICSPTLMDDLADAIMQLLKDKKTGIWNIVGPERLSKEEMARIISKVFDLDKNLINTKLATEIFYSREYPLDTSLNPARMIKEGMLMRDFEEGLRFMKSMMKVRLRSK